MFHRSSALQASCFLLTALAVALGGATCGLQGARLPAVSGVVTYSSTPLSGVTVELRTAGEDDQVEQMVVTNQAGEFRFDGVADGIHVVRVDAPTAEYFGTGSQVNVAGQDITLTFHLARIISLVDPPDGAAVTTATPALTWTPNTEAARYTVQVYATSSGQLAERAGNVPDASYTLSQALTNGEEYSWQVDATDAAGRLVGSTQTPFTFTVELP